MSRPGPGRGKRPTARDIRKMLLERRQELEAAIQREWRGLHDSAVDVTAESLGEMGERPALRPEAEIGYELVGSRAARLREIDQALAKMDEGTYGVCEACGQAIGERRMLALPFALRCTACQEALERRGGTQREARA
jgi:DnaK suppressor protein